MFFLEFIILFSLAFLNLKIHALKSFYIIAKNLN